MVRSFDHVNHWAWEVAKHQRQRRAGLAEISYNLQGRNRNSSDDTANEAIGIKRKLSMNESEPTKRRRGRPRRITDTAAQNPILGAQSRPSPAFFATDQSQSSKLRRKSASPRKNARHIDQPRAPTSIDMPYLGRCNPRVKMKSFQEAKSAYKMPHSVLNLHTRLQNIPLGLIPGELKDAYENDARTPRKSKIPPRPLNYLQGNACPYPPTCLPSLKARSDRLLKDAMWAHKNRAHEKQWGSLVNKLLGEFELWPIGNDFKILNTETCSIEPEEIRPVMPNGAHLDCDAQTSSSQQVMTEEISQTIGRMVDWCLALNLDDEDEDLVDEAFASMKGGEQSLNQTLSYIHKCPLFLDIEIKKTQSNRDPEVQLAIWASSALLKRQHHGWDTSMPMPAIAINGNSWDYFLFFEMKGDLVMMGPFTMGSTSDINGIYQIYYRLHILIQWGTHEYRTWFTENVLQWLRDRVAKKSD